MNYLPTEQILLIHARLIEETGGSHGVGDLDMLLFAIGRSQASFDNQGLYPDLFDKAAALMESLILNHPFVGGSKRTGGSVAGLFLCRNGYRLASRNAELATVTMPISQSQASFEELITWFLDDSQPIELTSEFLLIQAPPV